MRILGIETSCDETGVAVYDTDVGLRAHALFSQIALHAAYGGVVPNWPAATMCASCCPWCGRPWPRPA